MKVSLTVLVLLFSVNILFAQFPVKSFSLEELYKRHKECKFSARKTNFKNDITDVRDAAYAYHYWYPGDFKEVLSKEFSDTITYISIDKRSKLKLWPGKTVSFPLGTVDSAGKFIGVKAEDIVRVEKVVDNYIELISSGKERYIRRAKIIDICKDIDGYKFTVNVRAVNNQMGYIYKIEVSELPVSGDLIFKHFLFKYDLKSNRKFENLGLLMANDFGM